ncbi:MAG: DUF2064 domain-containing protein [Gemmatimonadota bacterium]
MAPALSILLDRPDPATGLAAGIGLPHALRLQRLVLRRVLAAAGAAGIVPIVWFRPPDARAAVQQWLGEDVELRPQASGPLGTRMAAAVAGAALPAGWLALLRLSPGVEDALSHAVAGLDEAAYVIGPSSDGGCYLIGGRAPVFAAARALASAGPGALDALRGGLGSGRHSWRECAVLRPLESASDARAARLLG